MLQIALRSFARFAFIAGRFELAAGPIKPTVLPSPSSKCYYDVACSTALRVRVMRDVRDRSRAAHFIEERRTDEAATTPNERFED